MTDVVALDPPRRRWQFQKLGQIFGGQGLLLLPLLGALQFEVGVALHQFDQIGFLPLLGAVNMNLAFPLFREPLLQEILLRQRMLHQQFRRNLHCIHLAVVLFDHPLQDQARFHAAGIGGIAEPTHQFSGAHLKQLNGSQAFVAGQRQNITAHR